jgi:hypothetical protein
MLMLSHWHCPDIMIMMVDCYVGSSTRNHIFKSRRVCIVYTMSLTFLKKKQGGVNCLNIQCQYGHLGPLGMLAYSQ